jgi:transposase
LDLTAKQWEVLESLIPEPPRRADRRGRPWREPRDVLSGILWVLHAGGAPSGDFPERYPPYHTCHRHFRQRIEEGVLEKVLHASAYEVRLVEPLLAASSLGEEPERVMGTELTTATPLVAALRERGIEMIEHHRRNRKRPKTQDGRKLRRYKRRWKIERLFAWLSNLRRLVVGYERREENYLGFVQIRYL